MRTRSDHRETVARRLELLRAELDPDGASRAEEPPWWETVPVQELAPPADDTGPPVVPVPGRHAARRRSSAAAWLADRAGGAAPGTVRVPGGVGPWHVTVLALLVAAGLAVTCWWVLRGAPEAAPVASGTVASGTVASGTAAPLVPVGAGPTSAAVAAPASASGTAATVTVDVAGRVRRPGVLDLPAGARVVDAIAAAGGARPGADLTSLNRARPLVDGEQIVVGPAGRRGAGASGPGGSGGAGGSAAPDPSAGPPGALVNLNTAGLAELDALPQVGPVTAQAILDYRTEHGGFGSVDELLDVDGIGEVTLSRIAPHVTV